MFDGAFFQFTRTGEQRFVDRVLDLAAIHIARRGELADQQQSLDDGEIRTSRVIDELRLHERDVGDGLILSTLHSELRGHLHRFADLRKRHAVRVAGIHPRIHGDLVMHRLAVEAGRVDEDVAHPHAIVRGDQIAFLRHGNLDAIRIRAGDRHVAQLFLRVDVLDRLLILDASAFFALQRRPFVRAVVTRTAKHADVVVGNREQHLPRVVQIVGELRDATERAQVVDDHRGVVVCGDRLRLLRDRSERDESTDESTDESDEESVGNAVHLSLRLNLTARIYLTRILKKMLNQSASLDRVFQAFLDPHQ